MIVKSYCQGCFREGLPVELGEQLCSECRHDGGKSRGVERMRLATYHAKRVEDKKQRGKQLRYTNQGCWDR